MSASAFGSACEVVAVRLDAYTRSERQAAADLGLLGAELARIRDAHGWIEMWRVARQVGLHKRTAERALRVYAEVCAPDGAISADRLHALQASVRSAAAPLLNGERVANPDQTAARGGLETTGMGGPTAARGGGANVGGSSLGGASVARRLDAATSVPSTRVSVRQIETLASARETVERAQAQGLDPCEALLQELVGGGGGGPKAQMANGKSQMADQSQSQGTEARRHGGTEGESQGTENRRLRETRAGVVIGEQMGLFDGVARRAEAALERARAVVGSRVLDRPEMDRVTGAVEALEEVLGSIDAG